MLTDEQSQKLDDYMNEILSIYREYGAIKRYQINYIEWIKEEYFNKLEFDHVFYDEIETFRHYEDEQFKYPYGPRKTYIDSLILDPQKFSVVTEDQILKIIPEIDYDYTTEFLKLQVS